MSRVRFEQTIQPYLDRNERDGFPHFNCVEHCARTYPEFARELHTASRALKETNFSDDAIRAFVTAWKKPCRKVREFHHSLAVFDDGERT